MRFLHATGSLVTCCLLMSGIGASAFGQVRQMHYEQGVAQEVNAFRQSLGRSSLQSNPMLQAAAARYARVLARLNTTRMIHTHDGKTPAARARESGYAHRAGHIGENIAWLHWHSEPTKQVLQIWKNSALHRAAMLDAKYTETGVAVFKSEQGRLYFCQVFGSGNSFGRSSTQPRSESPRGWSTASTTSGGGWGRSAANPFAFLKPDLVVTHIKIGKQLAPATHVRMHEVSISLENKGQAPAAGPISCDLYVFNTKKRTMTKLTSIPTRPMPPTLSAGQRLSLHFRVAIPNQPTSLVAVIVDKTNRVSEGNELNNLATTLAVRR